MEDARTYHINMVYMGVLTRSNKGAFRYCSKLETVTFAENSQCTSIGDSAFYNCSSLTSITIPEGVTSIGSYAFYNCSSLTGVYITDIAAWCNIEFGNSSANPLYYAHNLYLNGTQVTDLEIPDTVTEIKAYAFYGWNGTSITIPSSVTSIGSYAFYNCSSLTSITIPEGVTSIGDRSFYNCTRLTKINYNAANCADLSSSNYVFSNVGKDGNGITVNIGANVQRIPAYLFCPYSSSSYFPKIIRVVFAENSQCTSIGSLAFFSCSSLKTVYYGGTASEWSKISISNSNSPLTSATRYYFSETNPFEGDNAVSSGNYWHYDTDNKTPVIWKKEN